LTLKSNIDAHQESTNAPWRLTFVSWSFDFGLFLFKQVLDDVSVTPARCSQGSALVLQGLAEIHEPLHDVGRLEAGVERVAGKTRQTYDVVRDVDVDAQQIVAKLGAFVSLLLDGGNGQESGMGVDAEFKLTAKIGRLLRPKSL